MSVHESHVSVDDVGRSVSSGEKGRTRKLRGKSKTKHWSWIRSTKGFVRKMSEDFDISLEETLARLAYSHQSLCYTYVLRYLLEHHSLTNARTTVSRNYRLCFKYGYFSYTNASLQKAFINPPEPCGVLYMMDGCTFLGFKILTTIHCHYKTWKSQDIF